MKKPPLAQVQEIQDWLHDYLDVEIDPYDFSSYLEEWVEAEGVRGVRVSFDTSPGDLKPAQLKKFEKWLIDNSKGEEWVSEGDIYAPAYLYFNEIEKLPPGSWGIHFTKSRSFDAFEKGTTIEGMGLSVYKKQKDVVDCGKNLNLGNDGVGPSEIVFGFAFPALQRNVLHMGLDKYGQNAVLFQTDGAVRAWHVGDEEYQMIFPLCSEYNVIPLVEPRPGDIQIETEGGEAAAFKTLEDVIAYAERDEKRAVQANPSRRLVRL